MEVSDSRIESFRNERNMNSVCDRNETIKSFQRSSLTSSIEKCGKLEEYGFNNIDIESKIFFG